MLHPEIGRALLDRLLDQLNPYAVIESPPRLEGRAMSAMLAPKKQSGGGASREAAREAPPPRAPREVGVQGV
jgi:translation initiation factor IF-3